MSQFIETKTDKDEFDIRTMDDIKEELAEYGFIPSPIQEPKGTIFKLDTSMLQLMHELREKKL